MSDLSDEYTKNFTAERKKEFNRRFRDDYDPAMSERSNIIRILMEMRELGLANGGLSSIKYDFDKEQGSMGPVFETDDPKEAAKEILRRLIRVETGQIPLSKNISLLLGGPELSLGIGDEVPLFGGGLKFGAGKDFTSGEEQIDFRFGKGLNNGGLEFILGKGEEGAGGKFIVRKQFKDGGITRVPFQDRRVKAHGLAKGGLALMLGE